MPVSPKRYQPPNSWRTQKPSFWTTYKFTFLIILSLSALAVLHRFDRNGIPPIFAGLIKVPQIRSKALRRASWDTMVDTSKPRRRLNPFSRPRRAFTSSVYTDNFVPLALALGYSISHTNDLDAQNADMVLFVRQGANVSDASIARLRKVGWKVRVEDDIALPGVEVDQIEPWHKWNLNKLRVWTWTEYERVLFIDADTLVKGDLSEVWKMPGVIAAAPDSWHDNSRDNKFNSGVLLLRPSMVEYDLLIRALSARGMHLPHEGDQPFLNRFYEYRNFGLPTTFNLNLVLYRWFPVIWEYLWPKAKIVHFTVRKPGPPAEWCVVNCPERPIMEWYSEVFREMLEEHGWLDEIEIHG